MKKTKRQKNQKGLMDSKKLNKVFKTSKPTKNSSSLKKKPIKLDTKKTSKNKIETKEVLQEPSLVNVSSGNTSTNGNAIEERNTIITRQPELEVFPKRYVDAPLNKNEVTLLVGTNIFGFQFRKGTSLFIDSENRLIINNQSYLPLYLFNRTAEDFLKEAYKSNEKYVYIQKHGRQPNYSLDFYNPTDEPLKCTLFGMNEFLLVSNFGSDKGLIVDTSFSNVTYLEVLSQSQSKPFKTNLIKILSENPNQIKQTITITNKDANGEMLQTPLFTTSYVTDEKVLPISYSIIVDGNSNLQFNVLPKTKGTILFYNEKNNIDINDFDEITVNFYNSLISCQLQQGLNYVNLSDVDKFSGLKEGQSLMQVTKLVNRGIVKIKEENGFKKIGVNFKILTVSGKTLNVDLLTALKKSEYKIKSKK